MTSPNRAPRHRRLYRVLVIAGLMVVALSSLVFGIHGTAAAMAPGATGPQLTVSHASDGEMARLVPGSKERLTFAVSADIDAVYAFRASVSGSGPLRAQLQARVTTATGEVVYSGPLADASFHGEVLVAGQPEEVIVEVELPLSTTEAEAAGTVSLTANFSATRP